MLADPFNILYHISGVCFNYVVAQNAFQYGFRSIVCLVWFIYTGNFESVLENYGDVFSKSRRIEMTSLPELGLSEALLNFRITLSLSAVPVNSVMLRHSFSASFLFYHLSCSF